MSDEIAFREWLKTVWQDDINRQKTADNIDLLREELKVAVVEVIKNRDHCTCDTCVALNLDQDKFKLLLMEVGIMYLLGENFNGAAAGYYSGFVKQNDS